MRCRREFWRRSIASTRRRFASCSTRRGRSRAGGSCVMADWTEQDSATYRDIAGVAVPRRDEMMATLLSLAPFTPEQTFRIVDIGCGDGRLAATLLERFPRATLLALDGSESMRDHAKRP